MDPPDLVYDVFDSRYGPGHGMSVRLVPDGEMTVQIVDPGGSIAPDAIDLTAPPTTGS